MSKSVYSTSASWIQSGGSYYWFVSVLIRNGHGGTRPNGFQWYNPKTNTYTNATGSASSSPYDPNWMYIYLTSSSGGFFGKDELKFDNSRLKKVDTGEYLVYDMNADFPGNYTGKRYYDVLTTIRKASQPQKSEKELVAETLASLQPQDLNDTTMQNLISRYANSVEALLEIEKKFGVSIVYRG